MERTEGNMDLRFGTTRVAPKAANHREAIQRAGIKTNKVLCNQQANEAANPRHKAASGSNANAMANPQDNSGSKQ